MTKTITLSGAEATLDGLGGLYACVYNGGAGTVYASDKPDIVIGANGVVPIAAGGSAIVECNGTLYLLGTGSVTAVGSSEPINFFKPAPVGGGGTGDVSKEYVDAQDATYLGQAKDYAEGIISNDNLLINPDLRINQRGLTEYTSEGGYTADGWYLKSATGSSGTYDASTRTLTVNGSYTGLVQPIERDISGETITISAEAVSDAEWYVGAWVYDKTTGGIRSLGTASTTDSYNSVTIAIPTLTDNESVHVTVQTRGATQPIYAKAEFGDIATKFIPPDPATELAKCQRYYQICTTGDIDPVDLRPSMATIKDIKERSDGNYEYIAEL